MSEQATQTKRPKKGLIILISVMGVLLVGVIALLLVLLLRKPEPALPVAQPGVGNTVVDDTFNPQTVLDAASELFNVQMSSDWVFPDGASPASDAYVANSTDNSLPFYFEVVLPAPEGGEEEVLYTSPVVPVGSAVRDITLSRDLDAGAYEADLRYHVLNPDDTVKSTLVFAVHLQIEA